LQAFAYPANSSAALDVKFNDFAPFLTRRGASSGHAIATSQKAMTEETARILRFTKLPEADQIFGRTMKMRAVRMEVEQAMRDDLPLLIEGESGTGKEIIARYAHLNSGRASGPFVRVNCGSMRGAMLEKEIFGAALGTASHNIDGDSLIGMAEGGTLFCDDIAEIEPGLCRRLANVVSGAASGSTRIVCASSGFRHRGAGEQLSSDDLSNHFAHRVHILPLRERKQDIPVLCEYLIHKLAQNLDRPMPRISTDVLASFEQWDWPGNIRELENWIARIVIFGTEEAIGFDFMRQAGLRQVFAARPHRGVHVRLNRRSRFGR